MRKLSRIVNPRRGDPKKIIVNDLELIASYLGKGLFATAYRVDDRVYIFANDPMKDSLAELERWHGKTDNPHIPLVERVGHDEQSDSNIYLMPFYDKLTAKHKLAWKQAKTLRTLLHEARYAGTRSESRDSYSIASKVVNLAHNHYITHGPIAEALEVMLDNAANFGTPGFEFNTANLSVDKKGNLVLRDVLFDSELLERYRKTQQQKFMQKQHRW